MSVTRSIGRWALAGLMINAMIGSGIFGVPGELIRLVGLASPYAFLIGALLVSVVIACFIEVASRFDGPGGPYIYARSAFGRAAGLQVAWFSALAPIAAAAAQSNLFANYLAGIVPGVGAGIPRALLIAAIVGVPALVNLRGAAAGKALSSALVILKLMPLVLIVGAALVVPHAVAGTAAAAHAAMAGEPATPYSWLIAISLAIVCFGGFEDPLAASGEVREPRRSIAFALGVSLAVCALLYGLVQVITVRTLGLASSTRPLADVATVLLGEPGNLMVSIGVMLSTAGSISAITLGVPRILVALAEQGDAPVALAKTSANGKAPARAVLLVSALIALLATSGSYRWALTLTAAATVVMMASVCASLIGLRLRYPGGGATRLRFGIPLAVLGTTVSLLLLLLLGASEAQWTPVIVATALLHWVLLQFRSRRLA